jgi:peptidyl-prolyl cis-trans isomerase C
MPDAAQRTRLSATKEIPMTSAKARHILVSSEAECLELKAKLEAGAEFESLAAQHSSCPSGKSGGNLGEFGPGQMVKEFDQVVFNEEVGKVHGPVKTEFGYHLLEITSRS